MKKNEILGNAPQHTSPLWNQALQWTAEEWRHKLDKLPPESVSIVIPAADIQYDPNNWKQKLAAAISGLNDRAHLEAAGRALSFNQSHEIFTYIHKDSAIIDKLSPIFVGMSHQNFCKILFALTKDELELLKKEALTEAIQHHLSLVLNDLTNEYKTFETALYTLGKQISTLPLNNITHQDIDTINKEMDTLTDKGIFFIKIANSALAIAWNTLRLDIIDNLSEIKEGFQKLINHNIGHPRSDNKVAVGLYAILENRLNTIFIDTLSNTQIQTMSDLTPAIEALVKFGIWYEQDYIDFGLYTKNDEDDFHAGETTSADRQKTREKIYLVVNENLSKLNLNTLKDLKEAQIYSRKALQEFLDRCRACKRT